MGNLSVEIGANTSKLVSEISKAKTSLQEFVGEMNDAADAGEKFTDVSDDQVKSFQKVISKLEKITEGSMNTKKEQNALSKSIQDLRDQWDALSNEARASDFGKAISDTMRAAKEELDGLKGNISGIGNISFGDGLKKQLRGTTNELIQLTAQYRAMSAQEKASASGQELARKMDQLREKAGNLKDTIGDVNTEITAMASDTPNLSAFGELLGVTGDLLSAHASIIAKVTGNDKALKDAIATVMAAQTTYNAVLKIANAQETFANTLAKIRKVQETAATAAINIKTAAEGRSVVVTKAATVAQKAFNAVAKANPYVILATALIAVGSALAIFTSNANKAAETNKKFNDEADKTKAAMEKQRHESEVLATKSGDLLAKFMVLQRQWKALKTEAEQKKWIDANQSAFKELGIAVNNVNDAYNVFIKNADKVIAALKAIAKAEAMEDLYKESIKKEVKWGNRSKSTATGDYYKPVSAEEKKPRSAYGGVPDEWNKAGLKPKEDFKSNYDEYNPTIELTQKGIDKINKYRNDQALKTRKNLESGYKKESEYYGKVYEEAIAEAEAAKNEIANIFNNNNGKDDKKNDHKGGGNDKDDYQKGSLSDLEAQLQKLQKDYKDGVVKILPDDYKAKVEELEKAITKKKIELGLSPYIPEGSLEDIDRKINKLTAEYKLAVPDSERRKIQEELNKLTEERRKIEFETKLIIDKDSLDRYMMYLKDEFDNIRKEWKFNPDVNLVGIKNVGKNEGISNAIKTDIKAYSAAYEAYKRYLSALQPVNEAIQEKIKLGVKLTATEQEAARHYAEISKQLQFVEDKYLNAAQAARNFEATSRQWKGSGQLIKKEIGFIGDLTSAAKNCGGAWRQMGKDWNKMTAFEKTTSVIENTINSIEALIGAYESIVDMIRLFGEISEIAAAKKVAANTAEMASDETKMATETANTQAKVANDQVEMQSEMSKTGVKYGASLASATASGASLPFPANIAAIAAGIAAVVAAFAMVFSAFAEGGIVKSGSLIGDKNLVAVNGQEMILNGTQQRRLFNLLNGSGSFGNSNSVGGEVKFVIKGNDLEGVLKNYNKKISKV